MKLKKIILVGLIIANINFNLVLTAHDFTVPKSTKNTNLSSAKKIKEQIIEDIFKVVRQCLVNLDYLSTKTRAYFLDQLELGLCGEANTVINSSSKSERQAYLDLVQEIEQDLINFTNSLDSKMKKLKTLNLKAEKLKG